MSKFIIKIPIFLTFTVFFYVTLLFFWGNYAPSFLKTNINNYLGIGGHLYSRLSEAKNSKDIDILFLGSSHTYRGFDPRVFAQNGFRTFNLGSSSQTPIQTKILLNRYLEKLNPKAIVYEVYPETFMLDGVESSLDVISNDKNDLTSLVMALKTRNIKTYNTFLFALVNDIFNLNKFYNEPNRKGDDTYVQGGYVERKMGYFRNVTVEKKKIILKQNQVECFLEIVSLIKKKNIRLVLVYAPITQTHYHSYTNNRYFDSVMNVHSLYYNFNKIMTLHDSLHFYDSHHLNQKGVELFNNKLIEILIKDKLITHNK
jgi:hypothetical protein